MTKTIIYLFLYEDVNKKKSQKNDGFNNKNISLPQTINFNLSPPFTQRSLSEKMCNVSRKQLQAISSVSLAPDEFVPANAVSLVRKPLEETQVAGAYSIFQSSPDNTTMDLSLAPLFTDPLGIVEKNALYRTANYLINSIQKNTTNSEFFIASVGSRNSASFAHLDVAKFVAYKEYKENLLFCVNEGTFNMFLEMKQPIRSWHPILQKCGNINLYDFFLQRFNSITSSHILPCHNLKEKILRRFLLFRLRICNQAKTKEKYILNVQMNEISFP